MITHDHLHTPSLKTTKHMHTYHCDSRTVSSKNQLTQYITELTLLKVSSPSCVMASLEFTSTVFCVTGIQTVLCKYFMANITEYTIMYSSYTTESIPQHGHALLGLIISLHLKCDM